MILRFSVRQSCWLLIPLLLLTALSGLAAEYKVHPWTPRAIETYAARLTSEGITIAIDPLFSDALAAQVFDKSDMVTRGIMPLAVIIFNSNDFAVEVEGPSIELLENEHRLRSVDPLLAVQCVYVSKPTRIVLPSPIPLPKITVTKSHAGACQDFKEKFLAVKRVEPHASAGGFLYVPVTDAASLRKDLANAKIYIPHIYRGDSGDSLMFFEIDLKAAIEASARK
ncbi:MAG: hypothetical protein ABSH28_10345 [Acidobacteriota bacterium]|jgi:hypothetical protein